MSDVPERPEPSKRRRRRKTLIERAREFAAIFALLTHPTIAAAAAACGVGESTLRRWLTRPAFRRRLAREQQAAVQHTTTVLAGATGEALAAIRRAMTCGNPGTELKAGVAWLDHCLRWEAARVEREELAELKQQVDELHRARTTAT
ncbi:MAG: hypothetical protein K2P78_03060 [Gemmataceae bacterium]|nr:hypothetical protein [Gemmataceae bacterium]